MGYSIFVMSSKITIIAGAVLFALGMLGMFLGIFKDRGNTDKLVGKMLTGLYAGPVICAMGTFMS